MLRLQCLGQRVGEIGDRVLCCEGSFPRSFAAPDNCTRGGNLWLGDISRLGARTRQSHRNQLSRRELRFARPGSLGLLLHAKSVFPLLRRLRFHKAYKFVHRLRLLLHCLFKASSEQLRLVLCLL